MTTRAVTPPVVGLLIVVTDGMLEPDAAAGEQSVTINSFDGIEVSGVEAVSPVEPDWATCIRRLLAAPRLTHIAVIEAGDRVAAENLDRLRAELETEHEVVYGDEDRLDVDGRRVDPWHKPAWSPERLSQQFFLGGLTVYRRACVERIDLNHVSSELDLAARATEQARAIAHVPAVLCHRRSLRRPRGEAASGDGRGAPVGGEAPASDLSYPSCSVIIPTGGTCRVVRGRDVELVSNAIRSVCSLSTHPDFEVVVVFDQHSPPDLRQRVAALDTRVRPVVDRRQFNFAAACNLGVAASRGEIVVLLNDDTEVVTVDWLERLARHAARPGVGAVGARLHYADGRIQHGGLVARYGSADHRYRGYPEHHRGRRGELEFAVNVLAVTGACLAVERTKWDSIGGMDEVFPLNYNDLDLCLRLRASGLRTVQDNTTRLLHLETSSRASGSESWEDDELRRRWGEVLDDDPFDNPNLIRLGFDAYPAPPALTRLREHLGVAWPSRVWAAERRGSPPRP